MDNPASEKLSRDELFSKRLSEAMKVSGKRGRMIADLAGIDAGYLSNLKQGKRAAPSSPVMRSLAYALGVREEWLATGEPPVTHGEEEGSREPASLLSEPISPGYGVRGRRPPLEVIDEIRAEVIRCIRTAQPPPARLLALIGEVEAVMVEMKAEKIKRSE